MKERSKYITYEIEYPSIDFKRYLINKSIIFKDEWLIVDLEDSFNKVYNSDDLSLLESLKITLNEAVQDMGNATINEDANENIFANHAYFEYNNEENKRTSIEHIFESDVFPIWMSK